MRSQSRFPLPYILRGLDTHQFSRRRAALYLVGAGLPSTSAILFIALSPYVVQVMVDNLRTLLTAMGTYHEWMSSSYFDLPSITTIASFYIGHLIGMIVRGQ